MNKNPQQTPCDQANTGLLNMSHIHTLKLVPLEPSLVYLTRSLPHFVLHAAMYLMRVEVKRALGPVYTKRQQQRCKDSEMTLAMLSSLKTMELLENCLQPYFGAPPLISMRTELLV